MLKKIGFSSLMTELKRQPSPDPGTVSPCLICLPFPTSTQPRSALTFCLV